MGSKGVFFHVRKNQGPSGGYWKGCLIQETTWIKVFTREYKGKGLRKTMHTAETCHFRVLSARLWSSPFCRKDRMWGTEEDGFMTFLWESKKLFHTWPHLWIGQVPHQIHMCVKHLLQAASAVQAFSQGMLRICIEIKAILDTCLMTCITASTQKRRAVESCWICSATAWP